MKLKALILGVALSTVVSLTAAPVVIDNFTVNFTGGSVVDTSDNAAPTTAGSPASSSYLGTRTGTSFLGPATGGTASPATTLAIGSGFLSEAISDNYHGYTLVNYTGLGGLNFSGGAQFIAVSYSTDGAGSTPAGRSLLTINFNGTFSGITGTDGTRTPTFTGGSSFNAPLSCATGTCTVFIPISSFGADALNINSASIVITTRDAGADTTLQAFQYVPEPATYAMFGVGMLALVAFSRRRRS